MTLTPGGLPYPESTGPTNQGANDIKALALAAEARGGGKLTQSGVTIVNLVGGNASIPFPVPFKAGTVPVVVANMIYGIGSGGAQATMTRPPTNTAFGVTIYQVSGAMNWLTVNGAQISWIAVGVAA